MILYSVFFLYYLFLSFFQVDVGGGQCVHAKIFQAGGGELSVAKTLYPKTHNDPLKAF